MQPITMMRLGIELWRSGFKISSRLKLNFNFNTNVNSNPILNTRNALGVEEGGSGIPLNRKKYKESVEFWMENVAIK
jgi:hypothetical protein